jgi:hypothetical protein
MMRSKTPPLYATGRWQLRTPFTINPSKVYTCRAIQSFESLREQGVDIYKRYYLPYGAHQWTYDQDAAQLSNMVTLMSPTEPTVVVPDSYIEAYPEVTTVPYHHTVLSLSIGAIPTALPLSDFKDKIKAYALATLGIDVDVKTHQAGALMEEVDQMTHLTLERARLAKVDQNTTLYAAALEKDEEISILREQNRLLMELVQANGLIN